MGQGQPPYVVTRSRDSSVHWEQAPQSEGRRLPRSRLPARRWTSAGEPSLGLLALKLQRRQAGRSLAMTTLSVIARLTSSAEAIPVGLLRTEIAALRIRFARNDNGE